MTVTAPVLCFEAAASSAASPTTVYDVLADVSTHLVWAGEQSPYKSFKLLTLTAPSGAAHVGDTFTSTGDSGSTGIFHDRSRVTAAESGKVFAFETTSRLERKRGKDWDVVFTHVYDLQPEGQGTRVDYSCEVRPQTYRPYWLKPVVKQLTRLGTQRWMTQNLGNLARLAETRLRA